MLIGNSFDSGAIERFAYDPVQRMLVIFFKSGGVYEYRDVSQATFRSFWGAGSKGQFFHRDIRNQFESRQLSQSEVEAIEREFERGSSGETTQMMLVEIAQIERRNRAPVFF
jgi:KTSC domain